MDDVYATVNATWPLPVPAMSFEEGRRAAKRLFRFAGVPWVGDHEVGETSGSFPTGVYVGTLKINVARGWPGLVHQLSHYLHRRLNPAAPAHAQDHAQFEQKLIEHVVRRGWLAGALRPKAKQV